MMSSSPAHYEMGRKDECILTDSSEERNLPSSPSHEGAYLDDRRHKMQSTLSPRTSIFSDRMQQLSAIMWSLEQDGKISDSKSRQIEDGLRRVEALVEDGDVHDNEFEEADLEQDMSVQSKPILDIDEDEEQESNEDLELSHIQMSIADVVASMRLRQQEQRHLHELTTAKLEAMAQRCLLQEQQMQDMIKEARLLRAENRSLGLENDQLRDKITEAESEASKREVAVSAMASAVAGLEGWIDDAEKSQMDRTAVGSPLRGNGAKRAIVRGKGRFRGRYYVDGESDGYFPAMGDAREIQDGVRAWIRGFKDVEDACGTPASIHAKDFYDNRMNEVEWGDFQSPAGSFQ